MVRVIAITHLLAVLPLITANITIRLVPLSAIFIAVIPRATGTGVLMIIAAVAAVGPAGGMLFSMATAASELFRTVAAVAASASSDSVCHSVHCMLLCKLTLGV